MYKALATILKRIFTNRQIYKYGFNWSPMYRRTTAKLVEVSEDLHYVKIRIPLNWKNRNYAGSIFGGSMLSASDPIYMVQLIHILGDDFVVWDKSATIKYRRPAKEPLYCEFIFSAEEIQHIKQSVSKENEMEVLKSTNLKNDRNEVFAEVSKIIYIADKSYYKKKMKQRQQAQK